MKGIICLLIILTGLIGNCFSQCHPADNFYSKASFKPPASDSYISEIKKITCEKQGDFTLQIDTTPQRVTYDSGFITPNKSFVILKRKLPKSLESAIYAKNIVTDSVYYIDNAYFSSDSFSVGYKDLAWSNQNFVFIWGGENSTIFYFSTKKKVSVKCSDIRILGMDDTAMYFLTDAVEVRINHRKHYEGTLAEIGPSGAHILKEGNKNSFISWPNPHHFDGIYHCDGSFVVTNTFLMDMENRCTFYTLYRERVYYNSQLIDSFIVKSYESYLIKAMYAPEFFCFRVGDTLNVDNGDEVYRYYKKQKALSVNFDTLIKSCGLKNYVLYNMINDYVVLNTNLYRDDSGIAFINDVGYTKNMLPYDWKANYDNLFTLFNMRTKEFLGYPKIVFTNSK